MSFSPIQRLLRRVPTLRGLTLIHARNVRRRRQDAAWQETQSVLIALGNITIGWAGISLILNSFFEIYTNSGGAKARKELPRNFVNKLEYMREIERDPACAAAYISESQAVRTKLAEMNEVRIALTHGLLMRDGYGPGWKIYIAKEVKNGLKRWNETHTSDHIFRFAKEVSDMGGRLSRLYPPAPRT